MGFFDDVQAQFSRGVAATSRAGSTVKLKAHMNEVLKRRQGLAMQLGASLYPIVKDNPALREGREELFDGIAACDAERDACQAEIDRLEAEAAAASAAAQFYECPFCHSRVAATSLFCSGCGKSIAQIQAAYSAAAAAPAPPAAGTAIAAPFGTCPACGTPVQHEGDAFCMSCGARLTAPAEPAVASSTPAEGGAPAATGPITASKSEQPANSTSDALPISTPAQIPDSAPYGRCTACGAPIKQADSAFCMNCGAPIGTTSSQAKED